MSSLVSFLSLCALLIAGKFLRDKVILFRRIYLPASVIAGILGLLIVQVFGRYLPAACTAGWNYLPGSLINIVFAALFLGVSIPPLAAIWQRSGTQLAYGQIVAWGQYVVGLGLSMFLLAPIFLIPKFFGAIIPVGFEGGHGTAAGLKKTFEVLNWPEGGDYAQAAATAGIVSAILVGTLLINWAVRKGYTQRLKNTDEISGAKENALDRAGKGLFEEYKAILRGGVFRTVFHVVMIALAIFIGFLIKRAIVSMEALFPGLAGNNFLRALPVFPLCMFGGVLIQLTLSKTFKRPVIDHALTQNISAIALDFLIVSAISMIRLPVIMDNIMPLAIIVIGGIAWNVFCVMKLAPRVFREAWFERAIVEMGQSMGVTATGLLLLGVVDPDHETSAYYSFGYKQLLHEPFMGGGIWTSLAIPIAIIKGPHIVFFISLGAILCWILILYGLFRINKK